MIPLTPTNCKDYMQGHVLVMIDHNNTRYIMRKVLSGYPIREDWTWHRLGPYGVWDDPAAKESALLQCIYDDRCRVYAIEYQAWSGMLESVLPINKD